MTRGRLLVTSGLSLVGAGVATYLTTLHVRHLGTGAASSCNFGGPFNCDVVNTSEYSAVLGVPVSHFALLLYLLCFLLAVTGLRAREDKAKDKDRARLHLLVLVLAAVATVASLGLAYVSVFVLKALCVFCTVLYAVNLALLGVSLPGSAAALRTAAAEEPGGAVVSTLRALRAPGLAGILVGLLCGFVFSAAHLRQHLAALHQKPAQKPDQKPDQKADAAAAQKELVASIDAPRVDLVTSVGKTAPSLGPANAPVTIVEVSDFECPFCRRAAATLKELLPLYPGKLRVVFRHFPLDQSCNPLLTRPLHEHACEAARAAVCVTERDPARFFPLAEKLFTSETDPESIRQAVTGVGLNPQEIADCMKGQAASEQVVRDIRECNAAGVRAVPVLFINGRAVRGALSLDVYKQVIDEELQRAASQR